MSGVICPGSYDPVHNGHIDVIARAAALFDTVVVTVVINPNKAGLFPVEERLEIITAATAHLPGVRVASWQGLLVDFAAQQSITAIVKGLRGGADLDYEMQMAHMNSHLTGVDTVYLGTDPSTSHLSSSLIKEVARLGGSVEGMLPDLAYERLMARLAAGG